MYKTQYLYINEEGAIGIGTEPPTGLDLDAIDAGILTVIKIEPVLSSHPVIQDPRAEARVVGVDAAGEECGMVCAAIGTLPDGERECNYVGDGRYHYVPGSN
jgi:hypothetical protein